MLEVEICDAKFGRMWGSGEWRVASESITQQIRGELEAEVASYEWRVVSESITPPEVRGLSFGEGLQTPPFGRP